MIFLQNIVAIIACPILKIFPVAALIWIKGGGTIGGDCSVAGCRGARLQASLKSVPLAVM
jgi:hypothetical protein